MSRILVVDDEPQMLRALRINLRARGHDVQIADTGATALKSATSHPPDLVVLDLGLPDLDGVDVIRGLRGWTTVPIIVLSGRTGNEDKVSALDAGADDYITKPFGMDELLARIRAVTRRLSTTADTTTAAPNSLVRVGRHMVNLADHVVTRDDGTDVRLTPTQWRVLEKLLRHPGKLITQHQLLHDVWGPQYQHETNYLRQYMAQLRRKLEDDPARPQHLITEPGMGYRYRP